MRNIMVMVDWRSLNRTVHVFHAQPGSNMKQKQREVPLYSSHAPLPHISPTSANRISNAYTQLHCTRPLLLEQVQRQSRNPLLAFLSYGPVVLTIDSDSDPALSSTMPVMFPAHAEPEHYRTVQYAIPESSTLEREIAIEVEASVYFDTETASAETWKHRIETRKSFEDTISMLGLDELRTPSEPNTSVDSGQWCLETLISISLSHIPSDDAPLALRGPLPWRLSSVCPNEQNRIDLSRGVMFLENELFGFEQ